MDNARSQLLGAAGIVLVGLISTFTASCAAGSEGRFGDLGGEGGGGNGMGSFMHHGAGQGPSGAGGGSGGGLQIEPTGSGGGTTMITGDPKTCAEAAANKTYIGCDFWPTVVGNVVWSVFDYAVVVANAGDTTADVKVEQNGVVLQSGTVAPNSLTTLYLPWVASLKGPDSDECGHPQPLVGTVRADGGAYHLTSTVPVTVYQFNALEYQAQGGPPGKDWSSCPAVDCGLPCLSYTNDASLLLPSTAMTGNYRVTGEAGWPLGDIGSYFAVTGTQNGTQVTVYVSGTGTVLQGGGVAATPANGVLTFSLDAGDVVEIVSDAYSDLSGSLVKATGPVQVVAGMQCVYLPSSQGACDHIEETVMPAETLGKHYFVPVPTGPHATTYGHIVRLYGNVDGTVLTYPSGAPPSAPTAINAGQVVDLGIVTQAFEVSGDHEFAVGLFLLGSSVVDAESSPQLQLGDPSQSQAIPVEQFRKKYVFLAPNDYAENYVDVIQPMSATLTLDGVAGASAPVVAIGSGYGVSRIALGAGNNGAHVLESSDYVGIQIIGYGLQTSYQYPGGLNLDVIAPPPPPPK